MSKGKNDNHRLITIGLPLLFLAIGAGIAALLEFG